MKHEIQSILRDKSNIQSENEEIQHRAVEYLKLSEVASKTLLASVLGEISSDIRNLFENINLIIRIPSKKKKMLNTKTTHLR